MTRNTRYSVSPLIVGLTRLLEKHQLPMAVFIHGALEEFALQVLEDADKITRDADGEAWIRCAQATLAETEKQGQAILAELEKLEAASQTPPAVSFLS